MLSRAVVECKILMPFLRTILFSPRFLSGARSLTFIKYHFIVIGCLWIQQSHVHFMNLYQQPVEIAQARTRGPAIRLRLELLSLPVEIPPSPPRPNRNIFIERLISAGEPATRRNATAPAQSHLVAFTVNTPLRAILTCRVTVIAPTPAALTGPATLR